MGEFLSAPIKDKQSEDNENEKIRYGSCGMQGWRKRMEDAHITDISQGDKKQYDIFGVFDGHGGKEVSQFVKNHFTKELISNSNFKSGNIKVALQETFLKMDNLMREENGKIELKDLSKKSKEEDDAQEKKLGSKNSQADMISKLISTQKSEDEIANMTGCTACVCVIDEINKKLYFANAGDSREVLCKKGIAYPMSVDHKPDLQIEKNRIYKADGWITDGRVKGNLNLSRGLGDLEYKNNNKLPQEEQMITANPDIVCEDLSDDCDFIIIGCDGIWDCLTNQEACDIVKEKLNVSSPYSVKLSGIIEEMMDKICANDIYNESGVGCDNMTCMIVQFKKGS
jgi:protein phosphatase 1G